jgi:ubiquinone/menaquinone biosynthesis C-methylase UbiE
MDEQRQRILDQFTKQAIPFTRLHERDDAEFIQTLIDSAEINAKSEVLDVACGPGLVACQVAKTARHVTGVDLTPAMIEQARRRQQEAGLQNLSWVVGDAQPLPFNENHFDRIITRYSFHHFSDPTSAFAELVRVCRPQGRVAVCDVFTTSAEQAELYDQLEQYRDSSHTHALRGDEFESLFARLADVRQTYYQYPVLVDELLSRSFPEPGGAEAFRDMIRRDIGVNRLGVDARDEQGLAFSFPVVVMSGVKPADV